MVRTRVETVFILDRRGCGVKLSSSPPTSGWRRQRSANAPMGGHEFNFFLVSIWLRNGWREEPYQGLVRDDWLLPLRRQAPVRRAD